MLETQPRPPGSRNVHQVLATSIKTSPRPRSVLLVSVGRDQDLFRCDVSVILVWWLVFGVGSRADYKSLHWMRSGYWRSWYCFAILKTVCNNFGIKLLNLCKSISMRIANGRLAHDDNEFDSSWGISSSFYIRFFQHFLTLTCILKRLLLLITEPLL